MFFLFLFSWKTSGNAVCQFVGEEACVLLYIIPYPYVPVAHFACKCLFLHVFLSMDNEVIQNDDPSLQKWKWKQNLNLRFLTQIIVLSLMSNKYLLISEWVQYEYCIFSILWRAWYFVFISFCVGPTKHLILVRWSLYTDKKLSEKSCMLSVYQFKFNLLSSILLKHILLSNSFPNFFHQRLARLSLFWVFIIHS